MPHQEIEYLTQRIAELTQKQEQLPNTFEVLKAQTEREIEAVMARAGILGPVRALERKRDDIKTKLQREADTNTGRIEELKLLLERQKKAQEELEMVPPPPPSYPEEMYGIKLASLDDTTRSMVMAGNPRTIEVLGGKITLTPSPETLSDSATASVPPALGASEPPVKEGKTVTKGAGESRR
jgi:predicted RNase H-like nuclease (RuvC/YqgF family)